MIVQMIFVPEYFYMFLLFVQSLLLLCCCNINLRQKCIGSQFWRLGSPRSRGKSSPKGLLAVSYHGKRQKGKRRQGLS
jgi:hypothetical protein